MGKGGSLGRRMSGIGGSGDPSATCSNPVGGTGIGICSEGLGTDPRRLVQRNPQPQNRMQ